MDQIITFKNPHLDQIVTFKNPKLGPDNNFTAYTNLSLSLSLTQLLSVGGPLYVEIVSLSFPFALASFLSITLFLPLSLLLPVLLAGQRLFSAWPERPGCVKLGCSRDTGKNLYQLVALQVPVCKTDSIVLGLELPNNSSMMLSREAEEHHIEQAVQRLGLCLTVAPLVSSLGALRFSPSTP